MNTRKILAVSVALEVAFFTIACPRSSAKTKGSKSARSATVRMEVRNNRAFVPLRVTGPNGNSRTAIFWVDSGGDTVVLSDPLAHELGLKESGKPFNGMGATLSYFATKPRLSIRGIRIDLTGVKVADSLSGRSRDAFPGIAAEGFLPATVLMHYDVAFNYPAHRFTLSQAGGTVHRGTPVRVSVNPTTGLVLVTAVIAGIPYGFILDTGATYTGVSRALMDEWVVRHPSWPHGIGAVGAANMLGGKTDLRDALIRIPQITLGANHLRNVGMVSRPAGVYERAVSEEMGMPVVGAIAGNVLSHFRVEVDYPAGIAYFKLHGSNNAMDLDCVGLIVQVTENGAVSISGVANRDGRSEVEGIEPGDVLVRVGNRSVTRTSLATVLEFLSGPPAEKKRLTIRRGGQELVVSAIAQPHPAHPWFPRV